MRSRQRGKGEKGIAIIMTGLVLLPLMMFAAFGVDLASWYSRISYLQKSADAAALAGTVWMPNIGKSTTEANASLQANGLVNGVDGIVIQIERGGTATSLRVIVTDTDADRVFSGVFRGAQELSRSAEAEYNLPIPLGSPLNYFGGDASKTAPAPSFSYSVNWPTDYTTRVPVNRTPNGCNMGTSSSQGLGAWPSTGGFNPGGYESSDPQCLFGASGVLISGAGSGSSTIPPPDHRTRLPSNGVNSTGCRIRTDGTGTVLGRWRNSAFTTDTSGTAAACSWPNWRTDAPTIPADAATRLPSNQPCRVGYETTGPGGGFWNGTYFAAPSAAAIGGSISQGNKLCTWAVGITTTDTTPPNPIASTRNPGFWALIEGPGTPATQGDAYTPRCYINANCANVQNQSYRATTNPDRGYWYVVKAPAGLSGSVDIQVFDASNNPTGSQTTLAGDSSINVSNQAFETEYTVYQQNNPLDFSIRSQVGAGVGDTTAGSCHWKLGSEAAFRGAWTSLCTLTGVSPGEIFLVNVRTNGTTGSGINGYAMQACANGSCTAGAQPALYAYADMAMYNNIASGDATFYLAEVGPQYAGRTLVLDLWDAGDASADATIYPMRPSPSTPKPVVNVPAGECGYTSSPAPNAVQTTSVGGATGFVYSTERPSDTATVCGIRSTIGSTRQFNGEWLRIRLDIPSTYSCTLGVNPETSGGSCWWGIKYNFTGATTDVTTWQARIEGNPVHLTQ